MWKWKQSKIFEFPKHFKDSSKSEKLKIISKIFYSSTTESLMLSAPKDIAVSPDICIDCLSSCSDPKCELCLPCLYPEALRELHQAFREHQRRGEMLRLFPTELYMEEKIMSKLSRLNKIASKWFQAKCNDDDDWCWKLSWPPPSNAHIFFKILFLFIWVFLLTKKIFHVRFLLSVICLRAAPHKFTLTF